MSNLAEHRPIVHSGDRVSEVAHAGSIATIIRRIEEAVDAETAAIRTDVNFDLKSSNARKSRYLYELNRATRSLGAEQINAATQDGLKRLRDKLEINEQAILSHLNAVKEVATLLQTAIQHAETDGTYSSYEFGKA